MGLLDSLTQKEDPAVKTIDGKLFWYYKALHKWPKNEEYRLIKEKGWERVKKSVKKHGIKSAFQVDETGTIYDGNNRYEALLFWINEGVTKADNGTSLEWIPVMVHRVPTSEVEALAIAAEGNGDKDFAMWNKDVVANNRDIFEQVEDFTDLVFDMDESPTFSDVFESYDVDSSEDTPLPKERKEVECPACHEKFIPS